MSFFTVRVIVSAELDLRAKKSLEFTICFFLFVLSSHQMVPIPIKRCNPSLKTARVLYIQVCMMNKPRENNTEDNFFAFFPTDLMAHKPCCSHK